MDSRVILRMLEFLSFKGLCYLIWKCIRRRVTTNIRNSIVSHSTVTDPIIHIWCKYSVFQWNMLQFQSPDCWALRLLVRMSSTALVAKKVQMESMFNQVKKWGRIFWTFDFQLGSEYTRDILAWLRSRELTTPGCRQQVRDDRVNRVGWIFGKLPRRGSHFRSKKLCCRFWR